MTPSVKYANELTVDQLESRCKLGDVHVERNLSTFSGHYFTKLI